MKHYLTALAAGLFTVLQPVQADETSKPIAKHTEQLVELGPPVGAVIPHDLSTLDADGVAREFKNLTGEKGVVLVFIRSLDWCAFCQVQTLDITKREAEFEAKGLNVVFLSYDTPELQTRFKKKSHINPTVLSDPDSEIIKAFGLLNESMNPNGRYYGAPHPVVFIVNNEMTIAAKLYEEDYLSNDKSYRNRPKIDFILSAIDTAAAEGRL
jgi:peroxiredoxin